MAAAQSANKSGNKSAKKPTNGNVQQPGLPGPQRWMPDLCSGQVVFATMVIAQLVALVLALAPFDDWGSAWHRLTVVSVFVQWIAITTVTVLCLLRPTLGRLPVRLSVLIHYLVVLIVVLALSELVYRIDHALNLGLTVSIDSHARFLAGNLLIAACVAAAGVRYFYLSAQRERIRMARSEARVQALQARIRPHFLFNSMNTIAGLIRQDPRTAERAVEDLSDLFRGALAAGREQVTLQSELDLVKRYVAIEQLRLGDRLQVDWQLDGLPMQVRLPPLTLQPLMENAIYHGIQQLPEGGTVTVTGALAGDQLALTIRNPLPAQTSFATAGGGSGHIGGAGIALDNIGQRLEHWAGSRAALNVAQDAGEFVVVVHLPLERA